MKTNGYAFWKKIDEHNPYKTNKELAEHIGIKYNTLKRQRSENRIPKMRFVEAIAKELGIPTTDLLESTEIAEDTMEFALWKRVLKSERLLRLMRMAVDADIHSLELAELALNRTNIQPQKTANQQNPA